MEASIYRKKRALAYFQNLYLTALADKDLSEEETNFLVQVATTMGITPRETANIMLNRESLEIIIPETEEERYNQLEDIVVMMMVDEKIHQKEYKLCLQYAESIGKDKKTLNDIMMNIIQEA